ncbi:MAG TPA: hypothetical protein PLG50_00130 [bacterium]|nr:hypothetical protein [bacterium]HQG44046.1 hypothetical protein [bacterium]HQJ63554.1 hypothetical protein [bacterium]
MGIGSALSVVPWKNVLAALPTIIRTARELMAAAGKPKQIPSSFADTPEGMLQRVERLEENEVLQAELVKKMSEQQQGLAEGLEFMASRITAFLWISAIALILALTSFVIVLLR